jgi:Double zinc ribbon
MTDEDPLCPECLANVHPDWPFCSHCGSRLIPGQTTVRVARSPAPPTIPVCENCGEVVDTTGSFCWSCGVPLATGRQPFIPAHPESTTEPESSDEPPDITVPLARKVRKTTAVLGARRTPPSRRTAAGVALLLLGVVVSLLALFFGWYAYSITASDSVSGTSFTVTHTVTLYPLNQIIEQITCQGWSGCAPYNSTSTHSYSQTGTDGVGALYDLAAGFVIGGVILGATAATLAFRGSGRRSGLIATLAVVTIILVALAPSLLLAAQPTVVSSQGAPYTGPGSVPGGSSPRTSFFGSCSGTGCGVSLPSGATDSGSWGPSLGWYLCLVSLAPLLAGYLLIRGQKRTPPGPITPEMFE